MRASRRMAASACGHPSRRRPNGQLLRMTAECVARTSGLIRLRDKPYLILGRYGLRNLNRHRHRPMRNLFSLIGRFRKDRRGNIAVIFAIALLPILTAVGCAVDYSLATRMRAKLQAAADAASVASIAQKSPGYTAAAAMTGNGSVAAAVTDANNVFNGNMSAITGYTNLSRTSTVTKTGIKLASNVQFSADVPVVFMKVVGYHIPDRYRMFDIDRLAAAVSRFLSDAGRFGIDGPAVDRQRTDAAVRGQSGQLCELSRAAAPSPAILRRKTCAAIPVRNTLPTIIAWAIRYRASARADTNSCCRIIPATCRIR